MRRRTIEEFRGEWDEAVFFVSESATYGRLKLAPPIGLVPLGPDPDSGLWEFWHVETGERPERDPESGRLRIAAESGLVLVLLPGGRTRPQHDPGAHADETVHEVTLSPFFLSKFEMRQAQWRRLTNRSPSFFGPERVAPEDAPLQPVEQVTWEECKEVLARGGLALPTEAQWEYAARAGTETPWWSGAESERLREAANVADAAYRRGNRNAVAAESWDDGASTPARVGSFAANPFGLHDVIGNVWEWCADAYAPYDRPAREGDGLRVPADPTATDERIYRGGGFATLSANARSSMRVRFLADSRDDDLGVRPARALDRE
jgi:formylglycine-generating enzyme required for sulfatase activity